MRRFLVAIIRGYQRGVSPFFSRSCVFEPTCSRYAIEAIQTHGALRGSFLGMKRILRCHPFHRELSYDPVPPKQ